MSIIEIMINSFIRMIQFSYLIYSKRKIFLINNNLKYDRKNEYD